MLAVGVPLYFARTHSLTAAEALGLLSLELLIVGLAVGGALFGMALLKLPVTPMWLASPLLAMGFGLDGMFVLLAAFFEARRAQVGPTSLVPFLLVLLLPVCF
jgi:putative Mn2+ efflux pump MntP